MITLEKLFETYFSCRKTKRWSYGAGLFEIDYEKNLIKLWNDLNEKKWKPGSSNCFIVEKPVKREIFAAPFRDRIVHHILINELESCFEKFFIKDSYACRKGKGTLAAIKRLYHFINSETHNGHKKAYILKLDIKGFFMSINRELLYHKLEKFIDSQWLSMYSRGVSLSKPPCEELNSKGGWILEMKHRQKKSDLIKYLTKEIVFNDPTKNVNYKSPQKAWKGLPKDKSLFTAKPGCGIPIGNLTSQVFANFFLTEFDHYIKHTLGVKCYVRYVDDFVIVHESKSYLKYLIPKIRRFLIDELQLTLHPKKIYLQSADKGVAFLGAYIKPNLILTGKRIKKNFTKKALSFSLLAKEHKPNKEELEKILCSVNSYLGIIRHYKSWKFRTEMLLKYFKKHLSKHFTLKASATKIEKRKHKNTK